MPSPASPASPPPAPFVHDAFPDLGRGTEAGGSGGLRGFFTTRGGGVSAAPYASLNLGDRTGDDPDAVRRNWDHLLSSQGLAVTSPVIPRLCHGDALLDADDPAGDFASWRATDADAVVTRTPGRLVAVTTADCLAALIADPVTRCVAAVHAGWRGTRDEILGKTLTRLFDAGWCRPASTRVALGPCLSPAALELGDEVAATLPPAHIVRIGGRPHFDLRGCNRAQALAAGVPEHAITAVGGCTRGEPELYFSHRRAQQDGSLVTGRLAACIVLV